MKIGIDARVLQQPITGVGNIIIQIIKEVAKLDKRINFILFFSKEPFSGIIEELRGFSKVIIPAKKGFIWEQVKLPRALKKYKIDIYHASWNTGLPFRKVCKYVVTIHDLIPLEMKNFFPSWKSKLIYKTRIGLSVKKSDKILTDSNYSKRKIIEYLKVPEDKIVVVYSGINTIFRPIQDLKTLNKIKEKYNLKNKFLLYTGGFDPRKNIDIVIESFIHYLRQSNRNDLDLVLVGAENAYCSKIKKITSEIDINKKIIFTGYIPNEDLVGLYNLAEILIYPSSYEGFGLPPLEAMACGCPVITSNTSSLPEVTGNAALLINNPRDAKEISKAINLVLINQERKDEMIKLGLERAWQFSWEKSALKVLEIYQKLL